MWWGSWGKVIVLFSEGGGKGKEGVMGSYVADADVAVGVEDVVVVEDVGGGG